MVSMRNTATMSLTSVILAASLLLILQSVDGLNSKGRRLVSGVRLSKASYPSKKFAFASDYSPSKVSNASSHRMPRSLSSASSELDSVIDDLLHRLPGLIADARVVIEDDNRFRSFAAQTQGYAIILASFKLIVADFQRNGRTLTDLTVEDETHADVLFNVGGTISYGVGFGVPLLVGLPDTVLDCGPADFLGTTKRYGLSYGIGDFFPSYACAIDDSLASRVAEYDLIVRVKLDCILGREDDFVEVAEVVYALDELVAAINLRLSLEDEGCQQQQTATGYGNRRSNHETDNNDHYYETNNNQYYDNNQYDVDNTHYDSHLQYQA